MQCHKGSGNDAGRTDTVVTALSMSSITLAVYIRRIRLAEALQVLAALAAEIGARYPKDEATPVLRRVIARKASRLAKAN